MKESRSSKKYNFEIREPYWQKFWEEREIFRFDPNNPRPLYSIDTPPPTISGRLHLGHVFSYAQAEVVAAYRRMAGFNVRYPFGLDNNGLPTERLVEKEGEIDPFRIGVEEFTLRCQKIIARFTPAYKELFRRLGFRWDLELEYSTISPEVQKLSQGIFIKLLKKGLIYRKKAPALYCPECQTSVAQAEVEDKEKAAIFYDLIFRKSDGSELAIATTRPELLPACVAVLVHPKDKKYKDIVGTEVETPLGTKVKVFTDDRVLTEKGTGAVMCCTYGDTTDVYWARTYKLPERIILDKKGKFTVAAGIPEVEKKSIEEGRRILVSKLKKKGSIKRERPISHEVGVHERCGVPIEIISIPQWFVKILEMKPRLLAAAEQINWYPRYIKKRYLDWVEGLKWDWCVSRERFFGIPIPVFYCRDCEEVILPSNEELPVDPRLDQGKRNCPRCDSSTIRPETNVLDTWFTSALTPDINSNHPRNGPLTGKMYPMSMRPQAHDIIRTWATYTILTGLLLHNNEVPWKDVMISGHILARRGTKISKKTGGGLEPIKLVKLYSADALRYAMCGASLGRDVYFEEKEVKKGKKLATKIYNAGRFVIFSLQDFGPEKSFGETELEAIDSWILFKAQEAAAAMAQEFERYEFSRARAKFEDFFWSDFCDNYLEIVKSRIYESSGKPRESAQYTLYHTYSNILKMAGPFLPHITEEMYHSFTEQGSGMCLKSDGDRGFFFQCEEAQSIHLISWPLQEKLKISEQIKGGAKLALSIISQVRRCKSKEKMESGAKIDQLVIECSSEKKELIKPFLRDLSGVTRAEKIKFVADLKSEKLPKDTLTVSA